jgi:beta-glucosidase
MRSLPAIDSLSLPQQVAQMLVVRASGFLFDHQIRYPVWEPPGERLRHWIQDLGVGGVILLGGSAGEIALRTQQLQEWATVPLLIAADIEEGVGQRFSGATWFPPPMALAAVDRHNSILAEEYAEQMGATIAAEARAIGLNWVLAPVVDVNNNPDNPVINVRAFGDSPEGVSRLATAFIKGAQSHPVLTAAKHFPGHGDTAVDSHLELPVLPHSLERLREVEIPPFKAAIAAGVDAVMSAHLLIPSLDPEYPATLSSRILLGELSKTLGFEGLIVTDALVMGAIANRYGVNEAPVLAVEAGADILMMPLDPEGAIRAICAAVETGRISPECIRASVERIWHAKAKVCAAPITGDTTHAWETIPPSLSTSFISDLSQSEGRSQCAEMLQSSMTIHVPSPLSRLPEMGERRNVIILDDSLGCDFLGSHTPAIALPKSLGYALQIVDRHTPPVLPSANLKPTLLQLFIRGNPFRGSAGLTETAHTWFHHLLETDQLQALIIYGSPYVLENFRLQLPAEVPYVFTYGQMPEAQAIALQSLFQAD